MQKRYNAELSNDYGNLVSRTLAMIEKISGRGYSSKTDGDVNLKKLWDETRKSALKSIHCFGYGDCGCNDMELYKCCE